MKNKSANYKPWYAVFSATKGNVIKAVSKLVPPKEVEDIVQETYVRICQMGHPNTLQKPQALMMTVAKNLAIDHLKRSETRLADNVAEDSEFEFHSDNKDQVFESVASDQEFLQFCEAVRYLPIQCRRVFVLRKVYGYSQKEIASEMKISQSTVEKHVAAGLKKCAEHMMKKQAAKVSYDKSQTEYSSIRNFRGSKE